MNLLQLNTFALLITSTICLSNDSQSLERFFKRTNNTFLMKKADDVLTQLKQDLILKPDNPEARLHLARIYKNKNKFDKAITILTEGLVYQPNHLELLLSLSHTYTLANKLDEAVAIYQILNEKMPNNPSILYKRGLAYLALGNFEKGWEGYEWRHRCPAQGSFRTYNKPRWDGSDLDGKTILLHAEQGLGDTLEFIRYAKLVKEKNGIVIAAVQKPLVSIIKLCPYIDHVISVDETPPYFDVHSPLMSLPFIFKIRIDTIPSEHPYLYADEQLVSHWQKELSQDQNFKIGICWQGNDAQRLMPLEELIPLCTIPGITMYSLQKTTGTDQLNNIPNTVRIITFNGDFDQSNGRFMDTAAVIKNLDLVITVDTSIGHLAGGLGVDTWIMLPTPADWRWIINRTDTPWYPTVRLFQQSTPDDWKSVIQKVAQELKNHIAKR